MYTETNGFDINPDLWYFEMSSYNNYGGHENHDWLAYHKGRSDDQITLTGMESLQKVYDSDALQDESASDLIYHVSLLVVLKFQHLIQKSLSLLPKLNVPVLATGHDYDFIYEYDP